MLNKTYITLGLEENLKILVCVKERRLTKDLENLEAETEGIQLC